MPSPRPIHPKKPNQAERLLRRCGDYGLHLSTKWTRPTDPAESFEDGIHGRCKKNVGGASKSQSLFSRRHHVVLLLACCLNGMWIIRKRPSPSGAKTPQLTSVSLSPTSTSVQVGQTQQFTATGSYSDGSSKDLNQSATWTVGNGSIAKIATGLATGLAAGSTTVQASMQGISGSAALMVQPVPPSLKTITLSPATATLAVGQTQQFTASGSYSDGSSKDLTQSAAWTVANGSFAKVATGLATALAAGSATVQASMLGISGSAALTVQPVSATLSVSPTLPVLQIGQTQQLSALLTYSDGSSKDVTSTATWQSSQSSTVTVGSGGLTAAITSEHPSYLHPTAGAYLRPS